MTRRKPQRLAEKLLAIRKRLRLSQPQLARQIDPEMNYTRISEFECGRRFPPIHVLLAYARLVRIHIDDLVDDETELRF